MIGFPSPMMNLKGEWHTHLSGRVTPPSQGSHLHGGSRPLAAQRKSGPIVPNLVFEDGRFSRGFVNFDFFSVNRPWPTNKVNTGIFP